MLESNLKQNRLNTKRKKERESDSDIYVLVLYTGE